MQYHASQVGWISKTFANCYICMWAYLKKYFNAIDLSLTTATKQSKYCYLDTEWLKLFHTATLFFFFCCSNNHLSPPFLLCFSYSLLLLFHHPVRLYEESQVLNLQCIPLPADTLLPPPPSSRFSYLHNTSPTGLPLLEALEMVHVTSNRKLCETTTTISLKVTGFLHLHLRSRKNLRKVFSAQWNHDNNQHTVIYHNDKIYCAITKDESTPWLSPCLQYPARLFHHLCQERDFPSPGFCLRFIHRLDSHPPLTIQRNWKQIIPKLLKLLFFLVRKTDFKLSTRNFHQEKRKLRGWLYLSSLSCHWSSLW